MVSSRPKKICVGVLSAVLGTALVALVACGGTPEPEGDYLSFLQNRERWLSTRITATVTPAAGDEHAVSIVAEDQNTGETLTFLVLADRLEGTHDLKVFGKLADMDRSLGRERLMPISNACTPGDRSLTTGSLSIESHDSESRLMSGSFISNVCRIDDADRAWTLADGKFRFRY